MAVVKTGVGGWMLTGNNTYSGGTQINAGNIEITNPGALGSGTVNVAAGAQLAFNMNGQTINNNITLNGVTTNLNDLSGALVGDNLGGGGGNTLSGTLTLAGSGMSNVTTSWSDKNLNLAGQVTGPGGLQVDQYRAGNSPPWIVLSNPANNFAGGIIINAGELQTNAAGVIPYGPGMGDVTANTGGTLNLNATTQNINGLWGGAQSAGPSAAARLVWPARPC